MIFRTADRLACCTAVIGVLMCFIFGISAGFAALAAIALVHGTAAGAARLNKNEATGNVVCHSLPCGSIGRYLSRLAPRVFFRCFSIHNSSLFGFFFGRPPFAPLRRAAAAFCSDVLLPPMAPDWQAKWEAGCFVEQHGQRYLFMIHIISVSHYGVNPFAKSNWSP